MAQIWFQGDILGEDSPVAIEGKSVEGYGQCYATKFSKRGCVLVHGRYTILYQEDNSPWAKGRDAFAPYTTNWWEMQQ